ncbi:hypothetical protein K504DRAFT_490616 [Pleomassaria siparia CBS 279.74]|uniref:Uncharacterized protein n=1 Tax=Pleomassaria siparia CBS 279.74 TaxID=1314801 RepID=A0A6G1KCG3_9PLEO|nr:hypothetical protein K504DRAFT_490616 [Pleomassaria siparia CBS 279.74]
MATDWDKLTKLRREHPKAKFALSEVGRQRKKQPMNPFLMVWHADILLRLERGGEAVIQENLMPILGLRPPITDARLLVYIYQLYAEAQRQRSTKFVPFTTNGRPCQQAWQIAAKSLTTQKAKLAFWSQLFTCAMKECYWEDVRWSLMQAQQVLKAFGSAKSKTIEFTVILANAMAFQRETYGIHSGTITGLNIDIISIKKKMALELMKSAFRASTSPDNPVKVETIRDMRFMARIFRQLDSHFELMDLWTSLSSLVLQEKLSQNYVEINLLFFELMEDMQNWKGIFTVGMDLINKAINPPEISPNEELPSLIRSWKFWSHMIEAIESDATVDRTELVQRRTALIKAHAKINIQGREMDVAKLAIHVHMPTLLQLGLCNQYWIDYCHLNSCFHDLRHFVENLPLQQQQIFHKTISSQSATAGLDADEKGDRSIRNWLQIEVNVCKFDYLLTISRLKFEHIDVGVVEEFVGNAVRLYSLGMRIDDDSCYDAGILAVMALLTLHENIDEEWDSVDLGTRSIGNSRILLQAGFLLQHMTASKKGSQNRTLLLLSTRVHLQLGLATIAYAHYSQVHVKEILHDTLSYCFLTRISQTHPFDVKGPKGFSPDAELSKVISTIQKMESRTDDFLYSDMQNFQYDQGVDVMDFKDKLKASLSKHLCLIERRRIARFKGEAVDATLDLPLDVFSRFVDSREFKVFPDFESARHGDLSESIFMSWTTRTLQPALWIYHAYTHEETCRQVYNEIRDKTAKPRLNEHEAYIQRGRDIDNSQLHPVERVTANLWIELDDVLQETTPDGTLWKTKDFEEAFERIQEQLWIFEGNLEKLFELDHLNLDPADQVFMPHENGLMYLYSHLETIRLAWRFCETYKKSSIKVFKATAVQNEIQKCAVLVQEVYNLIGYVATAHINALKTRGTNSILAQVRWGPTGEALRELMGDDEQKGYAKDYAESAIEALGGVLKVKLK